MLVGASRITITFAVVATVALHQTAALAAHQDGDEVRRWINEEWTRAKSDPFFADWHLRCEYEQHWFPLPEEMSGMEARVRGHPDHPEGSLLAIYRQRRAGTPSRFTRSMWFGRSGAWRLNEDRQSPEFPAGAFCDTAATKSTAFFLMPDALSVLDPRDGAPPGKDPLASKGTAIRTTEVVLTGGLWLATLFDARVENISCQGADWSFESVVPSGTPQSGRRWIVEGRWLPDQHRGFVSRLKLVESPIGEQPMTVRPDGWTYSEEIDRWVAGTVDVDDASGRLFERFVLMEVGTNTPSEIVGLTAAPTVGDTSINDSIRGEVPLRVVHDHRTNTSTVRTADGAPATVPLPADAMSKVAGSSAWLEWAGWLGAGVLAVVLIAVRVRSSRRLVRSGLR